MSKEFYLKNQAKGAATKRARTRCKAGHEYSPENTGWWKRSGVLKRHCKACINNKRRPFNRKWDLAEYGLTPEQFEEMRVAQNNLCLICSRPFEGTGRDKFAPAVDHCHKTDRVRGLVHSICNRGIGLLEDNPQYLRQAADYLERI
jgi:hypothetical protein